MNSGPLLGGLGVIALTIGGKDYMAEITEAKIKEAVKEYILTEFLPGENPEHLTDSTPLISGGILDSLATLKLVAFLEERFQIRIQAHEADVEHLNDTTSITNLIQSKL